MPGIRLSVRRYAECRDELIAFRNANRDAPRDRAYFDWRYLGRPGGGEPVIVWARNAAGETLGSLSLIPQLFSLKGRVSPVGVLGDISVSPASRGRGIAQRMFRFLAELDAVRALAACLVLPNAEAARPLAKCGWRREGSIERYVKILDLGARLNLPPVAAAPLNRLLRVMFPEPLTDAFRYGEVSACGPEFDALWQGVAGRNGFMALRDADSLSWRYLAHPSGGYRLFTLREGDALRGFLVFQLAQSECRIEDFLCAKERDNNDLLGAFLGWLRSNAAVSSVSLRGNACSTAALSLRRLGFVKRPDYQAVMTLGPREAGQVPGCDWYLTAGDKDV